MGIPKCSVNFAPVAQSSFHLPHPIHTGMMMGMGNKWLHGLLVVDRFSAISVRESEHHMLLDLYVFGGINCKILLE